MLKSFENISIDPKRWDRFGESRRGAMLEVFTNEVPVKYLR